MGCTEHDLGQVGQVPNLPHKICPIPFYFYFPASPVTSGVCYKMTSLYRVYCSLQRRHTGGDSVSSHQPHDCLLNRLFRRRSKKTSKLRVTGLCVGNSPSPGTGEFPALMASNEENVSIWWRHHGSSTIPVAQISQLWGIPKQLDKVRCQTQMNKITFVLGIYQNAQHFHQNRTTRIIFNTEHRGGMGYHDFQTQPPDQMIATFGHMTNLPRYPLR